MGVLIIKSYKDTFIPEMFSKLEKNNIIYAIYHKTFQERLLIYQSQNSNPNLRNSIFPIGTDTPIGNRNNSHNYKTKYNMYIQNRLQIPKKNEILLLKLQRVYKMPQYDYEIKIKMST